jgi:8-oxo-dGTP pyrophosphatase MutT (NUDIX family)
MKAPTALPQETLFSIDAVRARALNALTLEPAANLFDPAIIPTFGDHQLAGYVPTLADQAHRPAAVLIPVIARGDEASIILTRRASHLKDHAGQVAFPGGKIDAADASPLATALREADEEIGLASHHVTPLGFLDPYLSATGFRIIPVMALVADTAQFQPNAAEVEAVFEVPLRFLMDPSNHQQHSAEWRGAIRKYYAIPYETHYIWGVTAGILRNLYERLYAA